LQSQKDIMHFHMSKHFAACALLFPALLVEGKGTAVVVEGGGLSTGATVGIAIGSFVGTCLLKVLCCGDEEEEGDGEDKGDGHSTSISNGDGTDGGSAAAAASAAAAV
jgi:hypothetical protein